MESDSPDVRSAAEAQLRASFEQGLAGDSRAYRFALERICELLRAFFRRRMTDAPGEVDDLVQETVLAVHARRHTFAGEVPLLVWVYAIARHKWIDWLRSRRAHGVSIGLEDVPHAGHDPVEQWHLLRDALRLLAQLPAKQQEAIVMLKFYGFSVAEISRALSMSESLVKVSIHRGLRAIASRQENNGG